MKVIILAGGSGTRLWPLSRTSYPKQFIKLNNEKPTLFQQTLLRSLSLTSIKDIYVVTNEKYKFLVKESIEELKYGFYEENILVEPEQKNTLPAIFAGVQEISKSGNDFVVVFPSDHNIIKTDEFEKIILESEQLSKESIVTFGVKPNYPNTGYGYIETGNKKLNGYEVIAFKEKPNEELAYQYIKDGYYWNSGIFMFYSQLFINEVKEYAPHIYSAFSNSNNILEAFSKIDKGISIDYGIIEKSKKVSVVLTDIGWSDLGSFDAIYEVSEKDNNNNIINKNDIVMDSSNNYVYTEKDKIVSLIGVNDLVIVDNYDALLICKKNETQRVKNVVDILNDRNDSRINAHVNDYKAWGYYKVLERIQGVYTIKRAKIYPYSKIEFQGNNCNKQWIIINGRAKVIINNAIDYLSEGDNILIHQGKNHIIENIDEEDLNIIEIITGDCVF